MRLKIGKIRSLINNLDSHVTYEQFREAELPLLSAAEEVAILKKILYVLNVPSTPNICLKESLTFV